MIMAIRSLAEEVYVRISIRRWTLRPHTEFSIIRPFSPGTLKSFVWNIACRSYRLDRNWTSLKEGFRGYEQPLGHNRQTKY